MASASFPQNGPAIGGPMLTTHFLPLEQNGWLNSLWKTYSRELVDVRPSFEDKDSSLFIPANNNKNSNTNIKLQPHCQHAYNFCFRLHAFFLAFLTQNDNKRRENSDNDSSQPLLVKTFEQSCLRDYASMAFLTGPPNKKMQQHQQTRRLLRSLSSHASGNRRSVLFLHHEEFLQEFNHFELNGQAPSSDFIRRDSFGSFLYHMPDYALQALGCAMALALVTLHQNHHQLQQQHQLSSDNVSNQQPQRAATVFLSIVHAFCHTTKIVVRFRHVQPVVHMMDIKTGLVGKYITVKGHVVKARPRRLRVATAEFICQKCGTMLTHALVDGRYTTPTRCISSSSSASNNNNSNNTSQQDSSCKGRSFALGQTTMARYIDVQELRLQEAQEESTIHVGRTPRQLRVEVTHDLVDACRPGDVVLVVATVAAINTAAGKRGKISKETSTYSLYIKAHSITTMSESDNQRGGGGAGGGQQHGDNNNNNIAYTQQQLQKIVQLCHADHRYFSLHERRAFPFDLLVRSLCPSIIGHHEVKAGLVLCLLGGTPPLHQGGGASGADRGISIRSNSTSFVKFF
jgi:MCM OB domain